MKDGSKHKVCSFKDRIELCYSIGDIEYRPIDLGVDFTAAVTYRYNSSALQEVKANFCISPLLRPNQMQ